MERLQDQARHWGSRPEERARAYPCDGYLDEPFERWTRAVSVAAPEPVLFRWLCQLKVAPYSYDWIDNPTRRSPRRLTPGVERLARGQRFLVFELVDFAPGRHLSGLVSPGPRRVFGGLAITYAVEPAESPTCRLVARLDVAASGPLGRARRALLAWGDLVMMRKQLVTLKGLAERDASSG